MNLCFLLLIVIFLVICSININININTKSTIGGNNNKLLENIYFINLDSSKDRFKMMNEQAIKHNLKFKRYLAFHGKKINRKDYIKNKKIKPNGPNGGILGCALSHIYIWEEAIKNNYEYILVLEDDVILNDNFIQLFNKYYKQVPNDWDILHLGSSWLKGKQISKNILKTNNSVGAYAILFKLNTLKQLIKKKIPIHTSIDLEIGNFINEYKQNSYAFYPPLIKHNNNIISDRQSMDLNRKIYHDKSQANITIL